MNPRVLAFLRAHGLTLESIERRDGEVAWLDLDGSPCPWTALFMVWLGRQWRAWAAGHGFTKGVEPQREALRAGHDDFDQWLAGRVQIDLAGHSVKTEGA